MVGGTHLLSRYQTCGCGAGGHHHLDPVNGSFGWFIIGYTVLVVVGRVVGGGGVVGGWGGGGECYTCYAILCVRPHTQLSRDVTDFNRKKSF